MQCLIKLGRRLPPFRGMEGEDRVNCHVSDRGRMSVPRIESCSGDDVRQPGGLLRAAERSNRRVIEKLKPAKQIICFIGARPATLPRSPMQE
jgi:hypothetical protein